MPAQGKELLTPPNERSALISTELNEKASLCSTNSDAAGDCAFDRVILAYQGLVYKPWLGNAGKSRAKRKRGPALGVIKPHSFSTLPPVKRKRREKKLDAAGKPAAFVVKNSIKIEEELSTCHSNDSSSSERSKGSNDPIHKYFNYYLPEHPPAYTSNEIYFRMAVPEDRKAWSRLLLASCKDHIAGVEMQRVALEAACRIVAVRAADEALVGLVAMQTKGWICFIACDLAYRHNGLGSFLLFLALEWLRVRQVTAASLTPINRSVVAFYRKWGFKTYRAEGCMTRCPQNHLEPSDVVMERMIDAEVCLLPNGRSLKYYLRNYDSTGEVSITYPWVYYYYTPRLLRTTQGSLDSKPGCNGERKISSQE